MTTDQTLQSQRTWARIAGLMYLVVLVVDLAGLPMHSAAMEMVGSLCTVPLAFGLYYAVQPVQPALAGAALVFRLLEAALGFASTFTTLAAGSAHLRGSLWGTALLHLANWNGATSFGALVFTVGSTIFFFLFLKSGIIPRPLSALGLFASVLAMAACLAHLLRPGFSAMTISAWIPMLLAEISTGLWLLIKSVKVSGSSESERHNSEALTASR